jgi:hypothetical protein
MIPKIIHRIWLDDPMPDEFAEYGELWKQLHPGWAYMEWRSTDTLPAGLRQSSAQLIASAPRWCPKDWKRAQADILRLELLWLFGGVYADTDVEPLKPFDDLLKHEAFVAWSPNRGPKRKRLLTQAVMGAEPVNLFIFRCIAGLGKAIVEHADKPLAQIVGPWHITRTWETDKGGVVVLPEHTFYPQSNNDRDRGHTPDISDDTYAWHKWANTRDRRRGGVT